ncbi:hypothetical protein HPTD01_238 [Halomonas sp. TD01]|nr:hypothetical protein HPTD01_238 [Halomonas sp. TD01]
MQRVNVYLNTTLVAFYEQKECALAPTKKPAALSNGLFS